MANTLGNYDENWYAATALLQLEKALGLAGRVYRGYDKSPQQIGSVINLRRPTYFTAQSMPISSANTTDLTTDTVAISLDQWHGVQFGLTDKELAYTQERIIAEHIRPAASAVADKIDLTLNALARGIPWYVTGSATAAVTDITLARRRLFDNQVPLHDVHLQLNGEREQGFLSLAAFYQADMSATGGETQLRGTLGDKFGFEIFANQNVQAQQTGGTFTVTGGSLTVNAAVSVGASSITLAASTCTGTLLVGDIVQVGTGNTAGPTGAARSAVRNFVVTAAATAAANAITVSVAPKNQVAIGSGAAAKITLGDSTKFDNLAFHRNAFALAMAPLPEGARAMGARVASIADPITGLALRVTMWYEGLDAKVYIRIDALWGVKILDEDLAARYVA